MNTSCKVPDLSHMEAGKAQISLPSLTRTTVSCRHKEGINMKAQAKIQASIPSRCMHAESVTLGILIDFSLTLKAATLIFISWHDSAISSAKQGKSGSYYNISCLGRANVHAFHENPNRIHTVLTYINPESE